MRLVCVCLNAELSQLRHARSRHPPFSTLRQSRRNHAISYTLSAFCHPFAIFTNGRGDICRHFIMRMPISCATCPRPQAMSLTICEISPFLVHQHNTMIFGDLLFVDECTSSHALGHLPTATPFIYPCCNHRISFLLFLYIRLTRIYSCLFRLYLTKTLPAHLPWSHFGSSLHIGALVTRSYPKHFRSAYNTSNVF